jgi:hypothetical protein
VWGLVFGGIQAASPLAFWWLDTVEILHGGEIQPPLPGSEVGDVSDPAAVRYGRSEVALEQVVGDADARNADRGGLPLALHQRAEAGLAREPLDALAPEALTVIEHEVRPHPRRAVDVAAQPEQLTDASGQPLVLTHPRAGLTASPGVVARPRDLQHTAHELDGVLGLLRSDEGEGHRRVSLSLANHARIVVG